MTAKPTILVAEDDAAIRLVITQTLTADGYAVRATGSADALRRWVRAGEGDAVVTDVYIGDDNIFDLMPTMKLERSDLPFIVMSGQNTILTAASAAEHGAFDYLPKPFSIEALSNLVARALNKSQPGARKIDRETREAERDAGLPLIGRSEAMQEVYRIISRVMNTKLTILVEGEAGTGKELAARAIHDLGQNAKAPFVQIDLDSASERDVAETFAKLQSEPEATLYIDEIAGLSPEAQARLLGFVRHEGRARIIVSTQHDLEQRVKDGSFRSDLLYRLNIVTVHLPPLRERKEDIPEMAKAFLVQARDLGLPAKRLDDKALDVLAPYQWPGNVRELENLIYRLCTLSPDDVISAGTIESAMQSNMTRPAASGDNIEQDIDKLLQEHILPLLMSAKPENKNTIHQMLTDKMEKPLIILALSVTGGNKVRAAALLGLNRNTLRAKMTALKLADG